MEQFIDGVFGRLAQVFDPASMGEQIVNLATSLIIGGVTFVAYYLLWRLADAIARPLLRKADVDITTRTFLETALKYVLLAIGAVSALSSMGVNTGSLLASLGLAGLTLGFAARDALSNLISGLLIFWDRPFVIGDLVEVESQYGRVDRITLRSTRVVTPDGRMLAVPNSTIINRLVASYTNFPQIRLDVPVTIAVTEDLGRARALVLDVVRSDPAFSENPPARVVVRALNDYNVLLEVQVWLENERAHIAKRFELRETVFETLRQAGVEMPYETLQLAPVDVRSVDGPTRSSVT